MTSLFPHAPFAEDQSHAHFILCLHVARASAMSFSFLSLVGAPASILISRLRQTPIEPRALLLRSLNYSGRGFAFGAVAGIVMTWGRMLGREDIEWKDRAWRVLENKGEEETDWVALGGAEVGAVVALVVARRGGLSLSAGRAMLGGAGVGAAAGVPYMVATFARRRKPA